MSFSPVLFVRLPIFGNMTKLLPVYCIDVDRVQKSPIHDHCGISNGKGAKRNAERTPDRHPPSCNDTDRITGVTFIDPESRCILNGLRQNKAYSANAINDGFVAKKKPSIGDDRQVGQKIILKRRTQRV